MAKASVRTMRKRAGLGLGLGCAGLLAAAASPTQAAPSEGKGVYSGKVSLTGFYYIEDDGIKVTGLTDADAIKQRIATTTRLGYGELRTTLDFRRTAKERLDFRLDFRLRLTGDFDTERKFSREDSAIETYSKSPIPSLGTSARGYLGGPEYDLREIYFNFRATSRLQVQFGRMFVSEADMLKLDGLRAQLSFGQHWQGSAFVGGYPNPYSRSVLSDYEPPCGRGVAGSRLGTAAEGPCVTEGPKLGMSAGVGARYTYPTLWGSAAVVGSFFLGPGDGGVVTADSTATAAAAGDAYDKSYLLAPADTLDRPRIFVSWLNSWRPVDKVDLFSDLVVDLFGSAGPQLTRLVLLGTVRLLKQDRLTLRISYSHMSSLAINMYLNRLVYNRLSGTTLADRGISAVQNNLTILRTGREEARVTIDSRFYRRLGAFVEGRFRYRDLTGEDSNPAVYNNKNIYDKNTQNLAGDVSVGLRDTGSFAGLRGSLYYSAVLDFRATNHIINLDLGRDFWKERIGVTLNYVAAITKDKGATVTDNCASTDPFVGCFGKRSGMAHEVGLMLSVNPWRTLYILADYRFIAMLTDANPKVLDLPFPTVLSHAILGRTEFRW